MTPKYFARHLFPLISTLLLTLMGTAPAQAAPAFADGRVPLELVTEFNYGTYSSGLPDTFPLRNLRLGLGLRVIGSIEQGYTQHVLMRTTSAAEAANLALLTQLGADDWQLITTSGATTTLCHNTYGNLQLRTADFAQDDNRVYVSITRYPAGFALPLMQTCAQQLAQANNPYSPPPLFDLLPVLENPETAESATNPNSPGFSSYPFASVIGSSSNSTGFELNQKGQVMIPDYSTELLQAHFAPQLQAQGWIMDSGSAGSRSATSIWFKTTTAPEGLANLSGELELTGTLTLLSAPDNRYTVAFTLASSSQCTCGPLLTDPQVGIRGIPGGFISPSPELIPIRVDGIQRDLHPAACC